MKIASDVIISAADMSSLVEGAAVEIDQIYGAAFQCVFTGVPAGTIQVQASCDDVPAASQIVTWVDVSGASVVVTAAGAAIIQLPFAFYRWVRVKYTPTSGSGALTVTYNGKG